MSSVNTPSPVSAPSSIPSTYKPHGRSGLQRLFHERFPAFEAVYEEKYAADFGKFRLPLISGAAEAFNACGDWENGIARIRCPDCGYDYFRPFSCKSFFLCPSCGQKRTLLLGEYLADDLLLRLPHRQFGANEVRVDDTESLEGISQAGSVAVRRDREADLRPAC